MRVLSIIICLFFVACGPKSKKNSSGDSSSGGTAPPTVSVDTESLEDITAANAASFVVSGSCVEEGQPVEVSVGTVSPAMAPDCTNGAWTITVDVTGLNQTEEIDITVNHSPHPPVTQTVTNNFTCPDNYVGVPALVGYTTSSFCVMKYEAKSTGVPNNNAVSQASGTPYIDISQTDSLSKCTGKGEGYDLITNDEWQSIARNIELVSDNWAEGAVGDDGGLSTGHSDNTPSNILAANEDDNKGCYGTGQEANCNGTTWNSQRRTHTLSNGEVIWDIAGNVQEWVKDTVNITDMIQYGDDAHFSSITNMTHTVLDQLMGGTTIASRSAKDQFGPSGDYTSLNSTPYGGLGFSFFETERGGVMRGGSYESETEDDEVGVFYTDLEQSTADTDGKYGFRCVHHP